MRSGQPLCASTCNHTVSLLACCRSTAAPAVAATTPSSTATAAAATTRSLIYVSSSRRRATSLRENPCGRRGSARRVVYTSWPRRHTCTPDRFLSSRRANRLGSGDRAAELGDDPVAVAAVDRLDELDGPLVGIATRALEQEG